MQAIIMSAYRDFDQLNYLLDMYSKYFKCYVHVDKKASFADDYHLNLLNKKHNVIVISTYKIMWGSYLHLLALRDLLDIAMQDSANSMFHLISDTDFPSKSHKDFSQFFDKNNNNYIEVCDISNMPVMQKRYQIFHFQHIFDRKSSNKLLILLDKIIRNLQYALPIRRKISYRYKGLIWGSLTREGAKICLNYLTDNRIKNLKYCENAEEFWLTNALLNSPLKNTVTNYNLRYSIWDNKHVNGPRELNESDIDNILCSDAFFARKVIIGKDGLYKRLNDIYCN